MISRTIARLLSITTMAWALSNTAMAGETAPSFALPTDAGIVKLADLKGKVVYLDFWASWCPPCRKSFPWMNEMQQRYGRQGFAVVAVDVDKTRDLASKFLHEVPADFIVAYDPEGGVADSYQVQGMPSSFIIDRNGQIREVHVGFRDGDTDDIESTLQAVLAH
jgi:cytochrome c biogenesis protein CcmG/thiol:disulfide interchange protein DsbE